MGGERRQVELPVVDLEPALGEQAGHVGLRLVLSVGSADARPAHDVGDRGHQWFVELAERIQHARPAPVQEWSSGRTYRTAHRAGSGPSVAASQPVDSRTRSNSNDVNPPAVSRAIDDCSFGRPPGLSR